MADESKLQNMGAITVTCKEGGGALRLSLINCKTAGDFVKKVTGYLKGSAGKAAREKFKLKTAKLTITIFWGDDVVAADDTRPVSIFAAPGSEISFSAIPAPQKGDKKEEPKAVTQKTNVLLLVGTTESVWSKNRIADNKDIMEVTLPDRWRTSQALREGVRKLIGTTRGDLKGKPSLLKTCENSLPSFRIGDPNAPEVSEEQLLTALQAAVQAGTKVYVCPGVPTQDPLGVPSKREPLEPPPVPVMFSTTESGESLDMAADGKESKVWQFFPFSTAAQKMVGFRLVAAESDFSPESDFPADKTLGAFLDAFQKKHQNRPLPDIYSWLKDPNFSMRLYIYDKDGTPRKIDPNIPSSQFIEQYRHVEKIYFAQQSRVPNAAPKKDVVTASGGNPIVESNEAKSASLAHNPAEPDSTVVPVVVTTTSLVVDDTVNTRQVSSSPVSTESKSMASTPTSPLQKIVASGFSKELRIPDNIIAAGKGFAEGLLPSDQWWSTANLLKLVKVIRKYIVLKDQDPFFIKLLNAAANREFSVSSGQMAKALCGCLIGAETSSANKLKSEELPIITMIRIAFNVTAEDAAQKRIDMAAALSVSPAPASVGGVASPAKAEPRLFGDNPMTTGTVLQKFGGTALPLSRGIGTKLSNTVGPNFGSAFKRALTAAANASSVPNSTTIPQTAPVPQNSSSTVSAPTTTLPIRFTSHIGSNDANEISTNVEHPVSPQLDSSGLP